MVKEVWERRKSPTYLLFCQAEEDHHIVVSRREYAAASP